MHGRVIVHNMYEFQHSSSRAECTFFDAKTREKNAEVPFNKETEKARLPTDSCLYNSKRPSLVNCILTIPECRSDHHGSCTITAWSCKRVCSLCHPRASLGSQSCSPSSAISQSSRHFVLLVALAFLLIALALLIAVLVRSSLEVPNQK